MNLRVLFLVVFMITVNFLFAQKTEEDNGELKLTTHVFNLKNVAANRYLDLPGYANKAKTENGSFVVLWDLDRGKDRQVKFIPSSDGYYYIQFQHTKSNLDIHGCYKDKWFCGTYKTDNGAEAQIWAAGNAESQQWKLKQVYPGKFKIINRFSGKVLDASASNINKNGCKVQQWTYKGSNNQLWELVEVYSKRLYKEQ